MLVIFYIYQHLHISCVKLHVIYKHETPPHMIQCCIAIHKETSIQRSM